MGSGCGALQPLGCGKRRCRCLTNSTILLTAHIRATRACIHRYKIQLGQLRWDGGGSRDSKRGGDDGVLAVCNSCPGSTAGGRHGSDISIVFESFPASFVLVEVNISFCLSIF